MNEQPTTLSVDDLLSTASLGLRSLAGSTGLDRNVLWAHSCEMSDPTEWLGPHELLLTIGLCVPTSPADQVQFVRRLDNTHLAGVILGDHETCPPISAEMLAEADRLGFPVLAADGRIPWAAIARHVAAATASSQTMQVLKLSKLYQVATNHDDDYNALVQNLSQLLGVGIVVVDTPSGVTVLEATHLGAANTLQTRRSYQLPSTYAAELQLLEFPKESLDSFILVHLLKILALNVDRLLGEIEHLERESEQLFQRALAGSEAPEIANLLNTHSKNGSFAVAAFHGDSGGPAARRLALQRLPILVGTMKPNYYALIPTDAIGAFRELIEQVNVHVGVSSEFFDVRDTQAAVEEADRVLTAARFSDRLWVEYEGHAVSVLTRSRREATEIVNSVLGAIARPEESIVKLRETLFAYLRNDRHWQSTADELGVHRQTLAYRLRRIEDETGMNVHRSADLAALWVAYQAWESLYN